MAKAQKSKIVNGKVVRRDGYLHYVDGKGVPMEVKMNRKGAVKGHKSCK